MADKTISQTTPLYDLVVIGCSAGGIEALSRLTATLPPDFPAPMVVAQHLDPARPSHLGAILAHHSTLRVQTLSDETDETAEPASITMTPGVVYIVPADRDVEILDGAVRLCTTASRHPKPSIDRLFTSAAAAYGERLIAVILTGTGSDGTAGARAVKAAGGLVVIENPATASYPSMPAALAATTVDLVADLGDIGGLLESLLTGGYTPAEPEASTVLPALLARVREHSGIDFSQYKHPTILRRLQRRMVAVGTASIAEYSDYVQRHPDEYARLVASFLIQVTEFFRDAELVRYLREQLLPDLVAYARAHAGEHGAELRIWSAGCASGEEAYSLAILLAEVLCGDEVDGVHVRIFATDVDANAVAFARRGVYPAAAVVSIPPDLLARYFTPVDDGFAVTKRIRSMIIFGEHDLGQRAPFPQIDLVLCRNVLIYFTTELQRRALQLFAFALREDGRLVLGNAETTSPLHDAFVPDHPQFKIYRRHGDRVLVPPARMADLAPPILPVWRSLHLDTRTDTRTNMRTLDARTGEQTRRQLAPHFGSAPTPPSTQPHRSPTSTSTSTSTSARDADVSSVPDLHSISQRLRTSTDALGGIVLGLPIGVVMLDRHFDVQTINSPAYHLLGIYRGALGEDLLHVAKSVPAEVLRSALEAAFRSTPSDVSTGGEQSILVQTTTGEPRTLRLTCYPHFGGVQDRGTQDGRIPVDSGIPVGSAQERASPDQYADQYADRVERRVDERAREEESAPRQDGGHGHDGARRPERELATHVLLLVAGVTTAEQAERTRRSEEDDAAPATGPLRQTGKHEVEQEVERLRHELAQVSAINRELREANQDLTAANLRVQRVNEALVVREEEAQAASEEVKTLNEELQATNEELETLNEEMEATVEELHATNDDVQARARELQELAEEREQQRQASERDRAQLEAILLSMGDALVVVDASGEVRITNTAYEALLGRDASDVVLRDALGEPLSPEA
ncbi:MAG TPA: CheR family methyltransferase, partial [Ktedonobacterales bacterium]